MTIHLIVDGYNLIRQSSQLQPLDALDLQAGREALLELLSRYRQRSHHRITVVFDGWQGGDLKESRDCYHGMLIIYSRRGERADEVIKRLLRQERQRALVVTSDRDIQVCAAQVKATWISAGQFEPHLHEPAGMSEPEGEGNAAAVRARKKGPARRLPKSQRRRRQRLKKL
jgi:predicted RNA-binding protein with PIN domain